MYKRQVDAHEPVGFAPRFGGKIEVVILASIFEVAQTISDSLVGKRAYPEANERGGASDVMVEVSEEMCIRDRVVEDAPLEGTKQFILRIVGYLPHIVEIDRTIFVAVSYTHLVSSPSR